MARAGYRKLLAAAAAASSWLSGGAAAAASVWRSNARAGWLGAVSCDSDKAPDRRGLHKDRALAS